MTIRSQELTPLLGHIHVPKTGGSSVRKVLDGHYGAAHAHLYFDNGTAFVYRNSELANLLREPRIRSFSSHFVRRFPAEVAGRNVYYVTFLRHPVPQFVSYVRYTRKNYTAIAEPVLRGDLPPGMTGMTIREIARWILDGPRTIFRNFRENYVTNFFARYALLDCCGMEYGSALYRKAREEAARAILSRFLLVGITERMDDSWAYLRRRASEIGLDLPDTTIPFENVMEDEREPLDWIHPEDEVGAKLLTSVEEDVRLYQWALERFPAQANRAAVSRQAH